MKNIKEALFIFFIVIIATAGSIVCTFAFAFVYQCLPDYKIKTESDTKANKDAVAQLEMVDSVLTAAIERAKKRNAELDSILIENNKKKDQISK